MNSIEEFASSSDGMKLLQRERLEVELTELICELMDRQSISRADLARKLGTTRAHVTQLLRDGSNMTLRSISDVFFSLNRSLRFVDRPLSLSTHPLMVMETPHAFAPQMIGPDVAFSVLPQPLIYETLELTFVSGPYAPSAHKPDPDHSPEKAA